MSHAADTGNPSLRKQNRLAGEKSPYLLQHADNPVDWYPWGDEAFARARAENKPVFLSIGYATCHWCHVMEHESFENPTVAGLMNDTFINIKVDREERPDIDQVYMTVCQLLTGSGGWPLTVLLTPDKQPFFAGTYFPRETRYGRIGMLELVPRIGQLWRDEHDKVSGSADQISARVKAVSAAGRGVGDVDGTLPERAFRELADRYDPVHGGFGSAPKFPSPHTLAFLARYSAVADQPRALAMVEHTLAEMHRGGIFDQIGFGFHRYSTDARWLVPHFEKMLYDQATMILALTEAAAAGGDPGHGTVVDQIVRYVLRDMTSPGGGFYSAEDADSEGEEGRFYVWSLGQLETTLGADDAAFAASIWGATADGNFSDETTGRRTGANILHRTADDATTARRLKLEPAALSTRIEGVRNRLFEHRESRVHPLKDDKVLADWNGLMIAALARAGRVFGEPRYTDAARRSFDFVLDAMRDETGRLHHRWRDGDLAVPAFLDDHASLVWGALELYDATLDVEALAVAVELQSSCDELFWDADGGGYFFSADDSEALLIRQKEIYDGAIPSGNSVAARNLIRLARLTGRTEYSDRADRIFRAFAADTARGASAHSHLADALLLARTPSLEVVVAGERQVSDTEALLRVVRESAPPHAAVLVVPPGADGDRVRSLAPFTADHAPLDGKATAYVCRDFACRQPVTSPEELAELLDDNQGAGG